MQRDICTRPGHMIQLFNISKSFGGLKALDTVSLEAAAGSIHGIIGENGAGKSTLMKVLTGFITRSDGEIVVGGKKVSLNSPGDALALGIGMLYQEPLDFPQFSVLENFMAGAEQCSPASARQTLAALCLDFGFDLRADSIVEHLTVGERQQLELLRLIRDGRRVLILDEPTTGISRKQQDLLFNALESLRKKGATIFLVSHKLDEIDLLCDRVTVLRQGKVTDTQTRPFNRKRLLESMFYHVPAGQSNARHLQSGMPVLKFDRVTSSAGRSGLQETSITVRSREVVGLAGVDGSGQSVFLKLSCGLLTPDTGNILRFATQGETQKPPLTTRQDQVFLPADRLTEGLFAEMSIREHHILAGDSGQFLSSASGMAAAEQAIALHHIQGTADSISSQLSGGNQQRLLLSLIPAGVQLILMENPTRGLDVQSADWTWGYLHEHLESECAIVFASPDLDEILAQATRVVVFYNGAIVLDSPVDATGHSEISRAITGQYSDMTCLKTTA